MKEHVHVHMYVLLLPLPLDELFETLSHGCCESRLIFSDNFLLITCHWTGWVMRRCAPLRWKPRSRHDNQRQPHAHQRHLMGRNPICACHTMCVPLSRQRGTKPHGADGDWCTELVSRAVHQRTLERGACCRRGRPRRGALFASGANLRSLEDAHLD